MKRRGRNLWRITLSSLSWFERVPKVELHLHLEGAIPHEALWELVCKYGGDPSATDQEALRRRFEYFGQFVETWVRASFVPMRTIRCGASSIAASS
jgi:hypothetical protein